MKLLLINQLTLKLLISNINYNRHWLAAPSREARPVTKNFYLSAMDHYKNLYPADEIIFIVASGMPIAHTEVVHELCCD